MSSRISKAKRRALVRMLAERREERRARAAAMARDFVQWFLRSPEVITYTNSQFAGR